VYPKNALFMGAGIAVQPLRTLKRINGNRRLASANTPRQAVYCLTVPNSFAKYRNT
jgi:hypothetical protein